MLDDIIKDLDVNEIKKQLKTIERVGEAFAKLAEETSRKICNEIVKDCDDVVKLLDKMIEEI